MEILKKMKDSRQTGSFLQVQENVIMKLSRKDLRKLQRQITEDFLQEVRDSSFRRKNLHYRSCLQLQSVHFHRQKMLRPTVQHSVRVKSAKNSMLNLIRRKLKNVSDGRKKSDLMYLFMENTKEMTWLNISVKRWEVFCSQRKHGFSHMEQDVLNHLLYGEMFTARSR